MTDEAKQQVDSAVAPATSRQEVDNQGKKLDDDAEREETGSHEISRGDNTCTSSHDESAPGRAPRRSKVSLKEKATVLKAKTSHTAKVIKTQTIDTYQHASWCALPRWIGQTPRNWPRVTSFIFGIVVPLWILIGLAAFFGFLLAGYEDGQEIESNDAILAAQARIRFADFEEELLLRLPSICMEDYLQSANKTELQFIVTTLATSNATNFTTSEAAGEAAQELYLEMKTHLEACAERYADIYELAQTIRDNDSGEAFSSLSFNWNRCWNETLLNRESRVVIYPSEEIIAASHPDAQAETYQQEWTTMQKELFQEYLPANATDVERVEAFERSVAEATGAGSCRPNLGGTAWFFFTIMTTVGYGNQAPVTYEGRALIYSAGFISLIAFGAVLSTAGYVLSALVDDFVSRFWLSRFMQKPWVGMIVWGIIWLAWSLILATDMYWWWDARLPNFGATPSDSIWFAYISTSTIGLGDFYPQPEMVFASDALKLSLIFLVGFVFLSTFFNKIVEFIQSLLPARENSLEARLKATRFLLCWPKVKGLIVEEEEDTGPHLSPEEQAQVDRIEALKHFLTLERSPEANLDSSDRSRGSLHSSEDGSQDDHTVVDLSNLLDQEELVLRELLAHLEEKRLEGRVEYSA